MDTKTTIPTFQNRGLLKTVLLLGIAVLILWWFGRSLNWTEVRHSLGQADLRLLSLAILVICLTYLLRAFRWRALLKPLANSNLRDLFIANVVGFSAFLLLGRAGEVVRPALLPLRDRRVHPTASFITIFLERICDFVAIVLLFSVNLLWFSPQTGVEIPLADVRKIGFLLLIGTLAGLTTMFWFARRSTFVLRQLDVRVRDWPTMPRRIGLIFLGLLEHLSKALTVLANPRELVITGFWTALVWLTIVVGNLLIIDSFGIGFGIRETVFVLGWALVGSLVPTPGGAAGAFHAAAAAGLVFLGVSREMAAAIAIVIHLVDFAPAVGFALYYLVRGDVSLSRLRKIENTEIGIQDVATKKLVPEISYGGD